MMGASLPGQCATLAHVPFLRMMADIVSMTVLGWIRSSFTLKSAKRFGASSMVLPPCTGILLSRRY